VGDHPSRHRNTEICDIAMLSMLTAGLPNDKPTRCNLISSAVGMGSLALNMTVEIEAVVEVA
jgi:hypothetical protein